MDAPYPFLGELPPGVQTIPQMFMHKVQKLGDRTAMRFKEFGLWRDISWKEYGDQARAAALGMIALGLEPGQTTAIIAEN